MTKTRKISEHRAPQNTQSASLVHRQSQQRNAYTELVTQALAQISPITLIPGKTAQLFNSVSAFFNKSLSSKEKTVQGLQAVLATTQIALSLYMLINGKSSCEDLSNISCRLMLASQLLYNGVLLTNWTPADQYNIQAPQLNTQ